MKVLESEVLLLTMFVASSFQNELNPNSENVCLQSETYEDVVVVKIKKPHTVTVKKMCWKLSTRFRCNSKTTKWKEVNETRILQRSKIVPRCCSGYTERSANVVSCVPICSRGCLHGICTAPDTCSCAPGFNGSQCDQRIQTTSTSTTEELRTTNNDNSLAMTSTESSQGTEKSETKDENISDVLEATETDLITQTADYPSNTIMLGTEETAPIIITTNTVSDESSTAVFEITMDEREMSTETLRNENITLEHPPDLSQSVMASEEIAEKTKNYYLNQEKTGLENDDSLSSSENLKTERTEMPKNKSAISELRAANEATVKQNEVPWINSIGDETKVGENNLDNITMYNVRVFHFIPGLWVLLAVSILIMFIAVWWLIANHQKTVKKVQLEKKIIEFHSEEPIKFQAENVFWVSNTSEVPFHVSDLEMNKVKPVLKTFKPSTDDQDFISNGLQICSLPEQGK